MTSKHIETIYTEASKKLGKTKAKEYVSTTIFNILFDLEEAGNLSSESIEKALKDESDFCQNGSSSEVA